MVLGSEDRACDDDYSIPTEPSAFVSEGSRS